MSNEFTSVANTPGIGSYTVTMAYDLAIDKIFREKPNYRAFPWVSKRPERVSHKGSSVRMQKSNWFSDATILAAKTPLDEESDVDAIKLPATTYVDLSFDEYGAVVGTTDKIKAFSFAEIDMEVAEKLGDHRAKVLDEQVQDVLATGTNILYAGTSNTDVDEVEDTDLITSALLRRARTQLRNNLAPPPDGVYYLAGIHPLVSHDLRAETGAGGWRHPIEYGGNGYTKLITGELGEWEGIRFVENTWTRNALDGTGGDRVFRTWICGLEVVAEGVVTEPHTVIAEGLDRLNRFHYVGWKGIYGHALYRNESLVTIMSGSSVASL